MKKVTLILRCVFLGLLACTCGISLAEGPVMKETFPRLMGMNIGAKNYEDPVYQAQIAKLDVVILGFYRGWKHTDKTEPIRDVVKRVKRLNPRILVGQYTILRETYDYYHRDVSERDKAQKLDAENWWLRKADGTRVRWTDRYETWDINFTEWSRPDSTGRRYPQWLAERDFRLYFGSVPEFDIWYFDNIDSTTRIPWADWDLDGHDERGDSKRIEIAFRRGQLAHWSAVRQLAPERLLMGNAGGSLSSPEYRGQLNGAFLEGMIGFPWSIERVHGWSEMMERYRTALRNTAPPHLVGFGIAGKRHDYRFFRYGFSSCLLDNGYFSFTDIDNQYSSVVWFDEYNVDLGRAKSAPPEATWRDGVYRRDFENGIVLVNPTATTRTLMIEPGFRHIAGQQDPAVNNGETITTLRLLPKDGVVLIRNAE